MARFTLAHRRLFRTVYAALILSLAAACAQTPATVEAVVPEGARITHRAVFIGENYHATEGTVSLYQSDTAPVIVFEPNFRLPDPPDSGAVVALGRDGYLKDAVIGVLLRPIGRQVYAVPGRFKIDTYNEVWLWSPKTDKPVGLARLTKL